MKRSAVRACLLGLLVRRVEDVPLLEQLNGRAQREGRGEALTREGRARRVGKDIPLLERVEAVVHANARAH